MTRIISMVAAILLSGVVASANLQFANNDAERLRPFITQDPDQTIHYQPPTTLPNQPGVIPTNPPVQNYLIIPNNKTVIITTPDDSLNEQ